MSQWKYIINYQFKLSASRQGGNVMKKKRLRVDRVVLCLAVLMLLVSLVNGFRWAIDNPEEFKDLVREERDL